MAILTSTTTTNGTATIEGRETVKAGSGSRRPAPGAKLARKGKAGRSEQISTKASSKGKGKPQLAGKGKAEAAAAMPSTTATKTEIVLNKLRSAKGASIPMLMEATAWQAHSVRGFLSATVKKKLGLRLVSEAGKDGLRRYRIDDAGKAE